MDKICSSGDVSLTSANCSRERLALEMLCQVEPFRHLRWRRQRMAHEIKKLLISELKTNRCLFSCSYGDVCSQEYNEGEKTDVKQGNIKYFLFFFNLCLNPSLTKNSRRLD